MQKEQVLIIGAGLCGSLLALRLAQRGYKVKVMEMRSDLRKKNISAGRSINLALSVRGMNALEKAGVTSQVKPLCIPMYGRMIHDKEGSTFQSNYSGRENEYINSISRGELNGLLLSEAEKKENVSLEFNQKCIKVDLENAIAYFENRETNQTSEYKADIILGTDGAGSAVRKSFASQPHFKFTENVDYLEHGYKELSFPATANGGFTTDKNALHIWPRGNFMLIALPNLDGSFTVTLFLSISEGEYSFKNLNSVAQITAFFEKEFPDALKLMPNLVEEFLENPTGKLGTVKCKPWSYKNRTLLLGDAAHAIVPFYGQGMNCSFEDVSVLDDLMDKYSENWEKVMTAFENRKTDSDAIADLAIDNYFEMRDKVSDPIFIEKRQIEMKLEKAFPEDYFSKYSLVTFNANFSYSEAMNKGRMQDESIIKLLKSKEINTKMPAKEILQIIKKELV